MTQHEPDPANVDAFTRAKLERIARELGFSYRQILELIPRFIEEGTPGMPPDLRFDRKMALWAKGELHRLELEGEEK